MAVPVVDMDKVRSHWDVLSRGKSTAETQATEFTNQLLDQFANLSNEYETIALDRQREVHASRHMQKENQSLRAELDQLKQKLTRNSSVLVLIDGDGLLFEDKYVQNGESGGMEAARDLHDRVTQYLRKNTPDIPSDTKLLVRVYANMFGLAKAYSDAGICEPALVQQFARGFTKSRAHFDFIDCGHGKERADSKIAAAFNLYVNNIQTEHILLGCSHDNGYARLLEELRAEDYNKISLLEGFPFARELLQFTSMITTVKFEGLFRDSKIETLSKFYEPHRSDSGILSTSPPGFASGRTNSHPITSNGDGDLDGWHESLGRFNSTSNTDSSSNKAVPRSKTPSISSPGVTSASLASGGASGSWAAKALTTAAPLKADSFQQGSGNGGPLAAGAAIRRNRAGQRLDPPKAKDLDNETIIKVQSMKLCNNHHLRGMCYNQATCEHDHKYKPSKLETKALELIARRIPCGRGTDCNDPRCIAGHRCPWIQQGSCIYYDQSRCKFPNSMHHNDTVEVKTTLVR